MAQFVVQRPAIAAGNFWRQIEVGTGTRIDIGWAGFSGMKVIALAVSMMHRCLYLAAVPWGMVRLGWVERGAAGHVS